MTELTETELTVDDSHGHLELVTGVTGRAARMGHRLTIRMESWAANVTLTQGQPVSATLTVTAAGLQVISGEGGVKGLSAPERALARSNALGSLESDQFPTMDFAADDIRPTDAGFLMRGTVTIHGVARPIDVAVSVTEVTAGLELRTELQVRQSDFGVTPYSLMMGSISVADAVTLRWQATLPA